MDRSKTTVGFVPLAEADTGAWEDLSARALEPNPFFEPAALLPAVKHLGARGVRLLVAQRDGHWTACLPVQQLRIAGAVRTWCHSYCFLGTPLVAEAAALEALLSIATLLLLDRQHAAGAVAEARRAATAQLGLVTVYETAHDRASLNRREAPDYLDGMRSHRRRELQRMERRLAEEVGGKLGVRDRTDDPAAVDDFLALEASGWKGAGGTAMASDPAHEAFFRELCDGFRARGRLQLLALEGEDRAVAMKCNLAAGDGLFCFKIAQDEPFGRFSPGVQLELANVGVFHEQRSEAWMDSCADPDNTMINRLWPDRRGIVTLALGRRGVRTAIAGMGMRTLKAVRSRKSRSAPSPS